jgi:Glycosyl hydrolases family 18
VTRRFAACLAVTAALAIGPAAASSALPARLYAPYFETWTSDGITTIAQQSGARFFTLAFLDTLGKRSCTLAWNGRKKDLLAGGRYLSDIASLRGIGGDVIASFGGWGADQRGAELADSCRNVNTIARAYESVITTYGVTRLDMDVEGRSLKRTGGIDRRNKAIKLVEDWAAAQARPLQIGYTLPTTAYGLASPSIAVLQNAIANGARVDVVNIMTFDYYDGVTVDMGDAAITAAQGLFEQLRTLYPEESDGELWATEGVTMMTGIDDYPKRTEVTYPVDAQVFSIFARSVGIGTLSIWSVQRDASTWDFSRLLASYTRP